MRKSHYALLNKNSVKVVSSHPITTKEDISYHKGHEELYDKITVSNKNIKLAYVCNWSQSCGISTYSSFLYEELKQLVPESKIFSESSSDSCDLKDVLCCWERGKSLRNLYDAIVSYGATHVLIQHEWGLFNNARFFLSFIELLKSSAIKVIVAIHSVFNHSDKLLVLSQIPNIILHSSEARDVLYANNLFNNIDVIPHGCPEIKEDKENWNIFHTPYTIFQFGFGFDYKGVETAIDAIQHLITTYPKYKEILYTYNCSYNPSSNGPITDYYNKLVDKVKTLNLHDNIIITKGFMNETELDRALRTYKLCIFPYNKKPSNEVYGASGAIKLAMSYNMPVIASHSHLFDDIEGVVPRISNAQELSEEIRKIFNNGKHRDSLIEKSHNYLERNSWSNVAKMYLNSLKNAE